MATDSPTSELPVFDKTDGRGIHDVVPIVTPSNPLEPIVTRRELWSYYRTHFLLPLSGSSNGSFLVIFQQPRPGPKLPKGEHYLTIGWKQVRASASCLVTVFILK